MSDLKTEAQRLKDQFNNAPVRTRNIFLGVAVAIIVLIVIKFF